MRGVLDSFLVLIDLRGIAPFDVSWSCIMDQLFNISIMLGVVGFFAKYLFCTRECSFRKSNKDIFSDIEV